MNRPAGYLSKGQERDVGVLVGVLFVALMVAFVCYLRSLP